MLAAVLARPEDDLPRLVFADYLDENGEPERAEFVRVQCELAKWGVTPRAYGNWYVDCRNMQSAGTETECRAPTGSSGDLCEYHALRRREMYLIGRNVSEEPRTVCPQYHRWLGDLDSRFVRAYGFNAGAYCRPEEQSFERGLVTRVWCRLSDWIGGECIHCIHWETSRPGHPDCRQCSGTGRTPAHGPRLVAEHPVTRVVITDREPWHNDRGSNPNTIVPEELRLPDVWVWFRQHPTDRPDDRHRLPPEVWEFIQPNPHAVTAGFDASEAATSALSQACLAWAKHQLPITSAL